MQRRRGEKVGWIGGWLGGFLWLCLLSIVWFAQGRIAGGVLGLALFAAAVAVVLAFAPWRHAATRYWKLMLPVYALLVAAVGLCVWLEGGPGKLGLDWRSLTWLTPLLIPFATAGARRWTDGCGRPSDGSAAAATAEDEGREAD